MTYFIIGDESEIQDFIPISPPQVFNTETGQLSIRDENQLSPRRRKMKNKFLSVSPLIGEGQEASERAGSESDMQASEGLVSEKLAESDGKRQGDPGQENLKLALPGNFLGLLLDW